MTFDDFMDPLKLRHFAAGEFLTRTTRPGNAEPPQSIWGNIVATAIILDRLREELGRPVIITSCYRAPEYNRSIGGALLSQHQACTACDVTSAAGSDRMYALLEAWRADWFDCPEDLERVLVFASGKQVPFEELEQNLSGKFLFRGGLGFYETFVHIDTRGVDATW